MLQQQASGRQGTPHVLPSNHRSSSNVQAVLRQRDRLLLRRHQKARRALQPRVGGAGGGGAPSRRKTPRFSAKRHQYSVRSGSGEKNRQRRQRPRLALLGDASTNGSYFNFNTFASYTNIIPFLPPPTFLCVMAIGAPTHRMITSLLQHRLDI